MSKQNKVKTVFVCQNCNHEYAKWQGRCDECGEWNTLAEEIPKIVKNSTTSRENIDVSKLVLPVSDSVKTELKFERLETGIEELDRCLGTDEKGQTGMVRGSVVLIGGEPGIGNQRF